MWKARDLRIDEINAFKEKRMEYDISPVFSHMPYLPNFASPIEDTYKKSIKALEKEIHNCNLLDIPYIVTHLGSHLGSGLENGVDRIISALNSVLNKFDKSPIILLENSSGKSNEIGSTFNELSTVMEGLDNKSGVCLDTCHAFAQGYDLKTKEGLNRVLSEFDKIIGLKCINLIHLNDSMGDIGSKIDHHQHIGLGKIGEEGFINILNSQLKSKPIILETPVDKIRDDYANLNKVRELLNVNK
jgi:deoxyribonuclease-4